MYWVTFRCLLSVYLITRIQYEPWNNNIGQSLLVRKEKIIQEVICEPINHLRHFSSNTVQTFHASCSSALIIYFYFCVILNIIDYYSVLDTSMKNWREHFFSVSWSLCQLIWEIDQPHPSAADWLQHTVGHSCFRAVIRYWLIDWFYLIFLIWNHSWGARAKSRASYRFSLYFRPKILTKRRI